MSACVRVCVTVALLALAGGVGAQSLSAGTPATQSRAGSQLQPARATPPVSASSTRPVPPVAPSGMPSQLGQRPRGQPISARGPSQPIQGGAAASPAVPTRIYGRDGRLLNGMKPAGPNRVLDTRTGRYYDTVPAGNGARIQR